MESHPSGALRQVNIHVLDNSSLNFSIEIQPNETTNLYTDSDAICTVKLNNKTYLRLLNGTTTFEQEAAQNNIEVSGDSNLLRYLGKRLRSSN